MSDWCGTAGALPELAGVALIARAAQFSGAEAWGLRCVAKANLDFHFILYALAARLKILYSSSGWNTADCEIPYAKHKVAQLTHK